MTDTTDTGAEEYAGDNLRRIRPIADVLRDLGQGALVDDAGVALQDLVRDVRAIGKKGRLTLTVDVAPMKGDSGAVMVHAKTDIRPPATEPIGGVFFADDDGVLSKDDPRQMKLSLRDVSGPDHSNLRDVQ